MSTYSQLGRESTRYRASQEYAQVEPICAQVAAIIRQEAKIDEDPLSLDPYAASRLLELLISTQQRIADVEQGVEMTSARCFEKKAELVAVTEQLETAKSATVSARVHADSCVQELRALVTKNSNASREIDRACVQAETMQFKMQQESRVAHDTLAAVSKSAGLH